MSATIPELPMINLALWAPLVAMHPADPSTMHAATMEAIVHCYSPEVDSITAPCGAEGLKIVSNENFGVIAWPPPVRMIAPIRRCFACHVATGRKKPRL